jgi:phospholipid/cholesterol/gamma-HCH transport system ATP-binding protein
MPPPDRSDANHPIEVRDLVAGYDEKVVLRVESLAFERAKITCVLGASGCGKSTLLRNILMLERPMQGRILIEGEDLMTEDGAALQKFRERAGVLFQGAALFNSLTLAQNVAFPVEQQQNVSHALATEIALQKLALVGLAHAAHSLPAEVSGGMRKRAGIARAIARDPDYLFLDEPSAGLDPVTAAEMDDLITTIQQRFATTIVVITHELASLHLIADRLVMLAEGKVLAEGSFEELSKNPHQVIQDFFNRKAPPPAVDLGTFGGRLVEDQDAT